MTKVQTNGINLNYEVNGSGEPLVLISGLGYPLWQWHKMVPYLSKHFQVITFDNRGVGDSDKPEGPYTAEMLAKDTIGLLDALGVKQATILGHSMGGFIAQAIALNYPERVKKLILCSTNFGGPNHIPISAEAWEVFSDTTSDPYIRFYNGLKISTAPDWAAANQEIVEDWVNWRVANPMDMGGYMAQLQIGVGLLDEAASFENKLPKLTVPTLIIHGAHDLVVPTENAKLLAAKIPGSKLEIIPDAGHFFPIETPETASNLVIEFAK